MVIKLSPKIQLIHQLHNLYPISVKEDAIDAVYLKVVERL